MEFKRYFHIIDVSTYLKGHYNKFHNAQTITTLFIFTLGFANCLNLFTNFETSFSKFVIRATLFYFKKVAAKSNVGNFNKLKFDECIFLHTNIEIFIFI